MEKPIEERQSHIDLTEPCDEFGCTHSDYRGVLAWFLHTTCDRLGMKTGYCCHSCNNRKCGNPKHLYWGTAKENADDLKRADPDRQKRVARARIEKDPDCYRKAALKGINSPV